ncbi:neutral zinc metallopeptidase [Streptosporangium sp. NPDC002544]|uniref:neutral zinc metallopeptidase n=1 Tax=Streptosporangium sp. NPDC002544 TaxID=3154538 RepID=UPI00332DD1B9
MCNNPPTPAATARPAATSTHLTFERLRGCGAATCCGSKFPKDAQAIYCWTTKTIVFLLDKDVLTGTSDLFLFESVSHEYGHHVQWLSGIMEASYLRTYRTPQQGDSWRRFELQANCLSGAFIGSVWRSLKRPQSDFADLRLLREDLSTHGKASNYAYWLNRGFQAKGPGACNTFAAKSRVS